jgi:hypothetical protein
MPRYRRLPGPTPIHPERKKTATVWDPPSLWTNELMTPTQRKTRLIDTMRNKAGNLPPSSTPWLKRKDDSNNNNISRPSPPRRPYPMTISNYHHYHYHLLLLKRHLKIIAIYRFHVTVFTLAPSLLPTMFTFNVARMSYIFMLPTAHPT